MDREKTTHREQTTHREPTGEQHRATQARRDRG